MHSDKKEKNYKALTQFSQHKAKETPGGAFFTVTHRKAPTEYGVWARSKRELTNYFNKVRRHFISITEQS